MVVKDGTQRAIIQRLISGEYKLGQCQLIYSQPKWFLNLVYDFEPAEKYLDKDKILGVDLGCVYALYASSFGNQGVFKIPGDEATAFERKQAAMQNRPPVPDLERVAKIEERHKQKQHQARYCGEGRIGHGTKNRVAPIYQDEDKIARFRDTINHRYSKALVEYAEKNGYGSRWRTCRASNKRRASPKGFATGHTLICRRKLSTRPRNAGLQSSK
jgi:hypothetical protein